MTTITKTIETPGWDAGARTIQALSANGAYSFSVGQATGIVCGLNSEDNDANFYEIDHAFFIESNRYRIIESGVPKTSPASYSFGAIFKISRIDGRVRYYVNGLLVHTSSILSSGLVFLDCSLYAFNDEIFLDNATGFEESDYSEQLIDGTLAALDAYATTETGQWLDGELAPLTVETEVADWSEIATAFSALTAFGNSETELNWIVQNIAPLTAQGEEIRLDYAEISIQLSPLIVALADSDLARIQTQTLPLLAQGFESSLIPDYNKIAIEIAHLVVGGIQFVDEPGEINGELLPLEGFGTTELVNLLRADLKPLAVEAYLGLSNYFTAQWPKFEITFEQTPLATTLHTAFYNSVAERLHRVFYTTPTIHRLHETSWTLQGQAVHQSLYASSSTALATQRHQSLYASLGGATSVFAAHTSLYASLGTAAAAQAHHVSYASLGGATSVFAGHHVTYASALTVSAAQFHTVAYASLGGATSVFATHTTAYASLGGATSVAQLHAVSYASVTPTVAHQAHQVTYASLGGATSVFAQHDTAYVSLGGLSQVFTLHDTSWTVTPDILNLHTTSWKSVVATHALHTTRWQSDHELRRLHETRYRSLNTTPILQDGLIYVRV